ncbi:hypothetical protein C8T65DRAFT_748605 [Cerioporus squamosus]|nr:hypothetical protein C8T65DRAFT_748605 [Cerioporus squamosus]
MSLPDSISLSALSLAQAPERHDSSTPISPMDLDSSPSPPTPDRPPRMHRAMASTPNLSLMPPSRRLAVPPGGATLLEPSRSSRALPESSSGWGDPYEEWSRNRLVYRNDTPGAGGWGAPEPPEVHIKLVCRDTTPGATVQSLADVAFRLEGSNVMRVDYDWLDHAVFPHPRSLDEVCLQWPLLETSASLVGWWQPIESFENWSEFGRIFAYFKRMCDEERPAEVDVASLWKAYSDVVLAHTGVVGFDEEAVVGNILKDVRQVLPEEAWMGPTFSTGWEGWDPNAQWREGPAEHVSDSESEGGDYPSADDRSEDGQVGWPWRIGKP